MQANRGSDRSPQFGPSLDFDLLPDFFNRIGPNAKCRAGAAFVGFAG
jgi:hypothetical protein